MLSVNLVKNELYLNVTNYLKEFICVIYGYVQETPVNEVITKMLKKMVGEDEGLTSRSKVD